MMTREEAEKELIAMLEEAEGGPSYSIEEVDAYNRTDQSLHFCHRSVHINGSHRDQGGQVVSIIVVSQTDPIDSNLRGASELRDSATDLHNIAFICRGDGARIVPYSRD